MPAGLRSFTIALAAAVAVSVGLVGCGNDDGADLRDLTEETAIPSGSSD